MADRRDIYPLLLTAYLQRLSQAGDEGAPAGPFFGATVEVHLHVEDGGGELLVVACKHFRLDFAPTAEGMLQARRAIDELAALAQGNDLGLGDELALDPERGYHVPSAPAQALALTEQQGDTTDG